MYNHQLDTFLKAAETNSFSKAAEQLYISPSAVVQQIHSLESDLGTKLFIRTSHGVILTESGKILERDARILISFCQQSRQRITAASSSDQGTIRLGTSLHFKPRYLSRMLDYYLPLHPSVHVQVSAITDTPDQSSPFPLPGTSYDIREGIRFRMQNDHSKSIRLFDSSICLAVPPKHPLYNRQKIELSDLNGMKIMMLEKGHLEEMDRLHDEIQSSSDVAILDQKFYGVDTYSSASLYSIPFIIEPVYSDVLGQEFHLIPLETAVTVSYELTYAEHCGETAFSFLSWVNASLKDPQFCRQIFGDMKQ